jgi:hypothetical protein|tara:strand:- start:15 stop:221 length:207 start_codon:yes stop_codon:yes gene_type:complete
MAKKQRGNVLNFVAWFTGIVVSLAVAFGMVDGSLTVPYLDQIPYFMATVGWIVVITTLVGAVLAIVQK